MVKMKYTFGFLLCNFLLFAPIFLNSTTNAQALTFELPPLSRSSNVA